MATFNNLHTGVKGTAKEMQEFVASLKGRSPADAMGVVAQSHLMQAIVISVIIQGGILAASCVYSYVGCDRTPPKSETATVIVPGPVAPPAPAAAQGTNATSGTKPVTTVTPATTNAGPTEDAIKKVMNTEVVKPEDQKSKGPRDVEDLLNNTR